MKDTIKRIRNEREGFTLAELLIVVAIIAVLVAIAIPVFSAQLEKSREATDAANIRAEYAEVMTEAITDGTQTISREVKATQKQSGWQGTDFNTDENTIGGVKVAASTDKWTVTYTPAADGGDGTITITAE